LRNSKPSKSLLKDPDYCGAAGLNSPSHASSFASLSAAAGGTCGLRDDSQDLSRKPRCPRVSVRSRLEPLYHRQICPERPAARSDVLQRRRRETPRRPRHHAPLEHPRNRPRRFGRGKLRFNREDQVFQIRIRVSAMAGGESCPGERTLGRLVQEGFRQLRPMRRERRSGPGFTHSRIRDAS